MPYTLMKGLLWVLLAVVLGVVVGWLLRNVTARREVSRARAQGADAAELERLRGRVANLEAVVVERDRLRAEVDDLRRSVVAGPAAAGDGDGVDREGSVPAVDPPDDGDGSAAAPEPGRTAGSVEASVGDALPPAERDPGATPAAAPDVDGAVAVLGSPVVLDDLTVIDGIGPKVEELCHGIGIRTWFDLSTTEVSLLRTMLADAGPRFRTHDPSTWPEQAALLAAGRWQEYKALVDEMQRGRVDT